jgi:hypothetical protein
MVWSSTPLVVVSTITRLDELLRMNSVPLSGLNSTPSGSVTPMDATSKWETKLPVTVNW